MKSYLAEIENVINEKFSAILTWSKEISTISSLDTTFLITKKNFIIVGLNSINESLLEEIIRKFYVKYFEKLSSETGYINYINYENIKIEKIIGGNHDGSYNGFSKMINFTIGNIIGEGKIEKFIETYFDENSYNLSLFKEKLTKINKLRNKLGHNSEYYFKNNSSIDFDIYDLESYVNILRDGFIQLSKAYFLSMEELLDIQYKTLTKFSEVKK